MVDFFQSKPIITLQSICANSRLEADVRESAKKILVLVPCSIHHYHLQAIHSLLNQLKTVPFVHEVIVILNGKNAPLEHYKDDLFYAIEPRSTLINALSATHMGKGFALKIGFDYVYEKYQNSAIVVTLDADLQSFTVEYLLKLVYPIAVFEGHFNKGYYARFSHNKLDGRLTRLLVFPLLYAIQLQHSDNELLHWLLAFRYPLSGDVCFSSQLIPQLYFAQHWAYDLSLLTSVYHKKLGLEIYQTELADNYEHLHRRIEKGEESGLMEVAKDIANYLTTLFPLDKARLIADYQALAKQYWKKYQKLALFNGLFYAQETEEDLIARIVNYLKLPVSVSL